MSGVSVYDVGLGGVAAAAALGRLLSLDPAEAAARNARICQLLAQRRAGRAAREAAELDAMDAAEARARRLAAARVEAAGAAAALQAAGLAPHPGLEPPSAGAPAEAWDTWLGGLAQARRAAASAATAAQVSAGARRIAASLPAAAELVRAADALAADPAAAEGAKTDVPATVARILSDLDPLAATADRDLAHDAAADVLRRPDEIPARLRQLRLLVQRANEHARQRHDDAVVAAQLLDAIDPYTPSAGVDPDRLGHARSALADVVAGVRGLDDDLLDDVEALRAAVESTALAATVTGAVAEVLTEFGYQVGPDFSLGEASVGMLEVSYPQTPDHLVRLRVDATTRSLAAMVYRTGDGSPKADARVEAAWCADLDRALERLAGSGLSFTPTHISPPGARPTPATRRDRPAAKTDKPAGRTQDRERGRG